MDYVQLGQAVQTKYPQYANMTPDQVGQLVAQKYPQYQSQITPSQPQDGAQLHDTGSFLGNAVNSAGSFLGGIGHAIAHPIDTVKQLGGVAVGAAEKLIPGQQGAEKNFNNVLDYYKQRYGSVENFLKTAYQDPVGTAADASIVFGGAGAAFKAAGGIEGALGAAKAAGTADFIANAAGDVGKAADLSKTATGLTQIGEHLSTAGNVLNPINALTGTAKLAASGLSKIQPYLEEANLKLTGIKAAQYSGSRIPGGITKLDEAVDLGTKIPGVNPMTKLNTAIDLTTKMDASIDDTLRAPAFQQIEGQLPKSQIISALETAARDPQIGYTVKTQLATYIKHLASEPDTLPLDFLQTQKQLMGMEGYKAGGIIAKDSAATIASIFKDTLETELNKLGVEIPVPPEIKALYPSLPDTLPIKEYNQVYGVVNDYRKLLTGAIKKPDVGFIGKLISTGAGYLVGHGIAGGLIGELIAEKAPISQIRSVIGKATAPTAKAVRASVPTLKAATPISRAAAYAGAKSNRPTSIKVRVPPSSIKVN